MIDKVKAVSKNVLAHRYGYTLFVYLTAAALTGIACVFFMRGFEFVLDRRLDFHRIGAWCWLTTPLLFLTAVELIRRAAPCAAGTGIPQAIFAARHYDAAKEQNVRPLVSPLTMSVKVLAIFIGIYAGASTGREGPTVHIATCAFIGIMLAFKKIMGFKFDPRSAVVAGGAAGLAAAFNTPLAGVTFAIEELTVDYFEGIKDYVLIAIIIAAITAKSMTGEYAYFGKLSDPRPASLNGILFIGFACGILGAFFSTAILRGQNALARFQNGRGRYLAPILLSLGLLVVAFISQADVTGPGNRVAQVLVDGKFENWAIFFPLEKIAATLLTYWSGIAGGIFAPCLSIGSAVGSDIAHWLGIPVASCAMMGMAAFLSGTIQAPITSFVIIFEMTGHHDMLLPIMLSSLLAFMVARLLGAQHLYKSLSENYNYLLEPEKMDAGNPQV